MRDGERRLHLRRRELAASILRHATTSSRDLDPSELSKSNLYKPNDPMRLADGYQAIRTSPSPAIGPAEVVLTAIRTTGFYR
jgi:hypothetical protein